MCVTLPLQQFPHPFRSQGGRRALRPPQHLCGLRLSEPLGTQGELESKLSTEEGKTCLRRFFFLIKVCWFQVTSGCFWIAGRGSFCPSPKSVTQQSQPGSAHAADLYFSVFHAAGLAQANRQASAGKRGWERVSHLICTCLLAPALPVGHLCP